MKLREFSVLKRISNESQYFCSGQCCSKSSLRVSARVHSAVFVDNNTTN